MDVAVDTNILLSDIWQSGQRMNALLDYVEATRSNLVLHEVVVTEFRANIERQWKAAIEEVESAARKARRLGVGFELPDPEALLRETAERWRQEIRGRSWLVREVELNPDVVREAIHRAAHRIAPCARSGEEVRDALIWLGLMEEYRGRPIRHFAFITGNSRDFCGPDGDLAEELKADAAKRKISLDFYRSIDDFLREHAARIAHFTPEWVLERIDLEEVQRMVRRRLATVDPAELKEAVEGAEWRPLETFIHGVRPELIDVYVWEYADERKALFLSFEVSIDVVLHCQREYQAPDGHDVWHRDNFPTTIQRYVEISAEVDGENLKLLQIEDWEKM